MRPTAPHLNTVPNRSLDWLCLSILVASMLYAVAQLIVTGQSDSGPDYFSAALFVA